MPLANLAPVLELEAVGSEYQQGCWVAASGSRARLWGLSSRGVFPRNGQGEPCKVLGQ